MKTPHFLIIAVSVSAIAMPAASFAAKPGKGERPGKILKQYDTNRNGLIDGSEVEAFRKAFEADKTGPLKRFDKSGDGTLSDEEIAAVKRGGKKKNKS